MYDAHVHILETPATMEKALLEENKINLIIMSAKREEWTLAMRFLNSSKNVVGFGIHPWFAHLHDVKDDLVELESLLLKYEDSIVGEIGLDKVAVDYDTKQKFDWEQQVDIFVAQMDLASRLKRPVSIHSVQSHGFMLDYFTKLDSACKTAMKQGVDPLPCPPSIMLHSYSASKEVLSSLLRLKTIGSRFFFSYSHTVNSKTFAKTVERIATTPEEQLLIESDVHDILQVPEAMERAVDLVANAKAWSREKAIEVTTRNALRYLQRLA